MIATLAEFKSYLWITDSSQDTVLQLIIDWANKTIVNYIGRNIESDDYIEYIDWNAQNSILLENYPVSGLTKIENNTWTLDNPVWEEVESSSYKLSPNDWRIFLLFNLIRGFQNYKITYTAWYTTIPADLKLATLKLASNTYNTQDGIKSESVNWDRLEFITSMSNDVISILNSYKDLDV